MGKEIQADQNDFDPDAKPVLEDWKQAKDTRDSSVATFSIVAGFIVLLTVLITGVICFIKSLEVEASDYSITKFKLDQHPELKPFIEEAMRDDKMTRAEYETICAQELRLEAKKLRDKLTVDENAP